MVLTLKYLRGEVNVCCGAGEAVGDQEEDRYMGVEHNANLYCQNLERLGLLMVLIL